MKDVLLHNVACAILAGGKSSRMGVYKAIVKYKGKELILYLLEDLYNIFDDIVISVSNSSQLRLLLNTIGNYENVRVLIDPIVRIRSPLVGLLTCLTGVHKEYVFVVACDMPYVSRKVVLHLYRQLERDEPDAVVPRWPNGFLEPLCAIYRRATTLKKLMDRICLNDHSMRGLINSLKSVKYLSIEQLREQGIEPKVFYNINKLHEIEI